MKCLWQFIKVIYYKLKYGLQKDQSSTELGASTLLDDSWMSADSFLHRLCKVRSKIFLFVSLFQTFRILYIEDIGWGIFKVKIIAGFLLASTRSFCGWWRSSVLGKCTKPGSPHGLISSWNEYRFLFCPFFLVVSKTPIEQKI